MESWLAAPITLLVLLFALWFHTHVRGVLPEDPPRGLRRAHPRPTPMAGSILGAGIAVYFFCLTLPWLAAAVTMTWLVGLLDDILKERGGDMGWRSKAVGLLLAAACATVHLDATLDLSARDLSLAFLLLFAVTNAFNFLDNTDGVCASLGVLALLLATGGHGPLAPIAFVYLGFLVLNWPRPLLFVGDSGAYVLGICAGTAAAGALPDWPMTLAPIAIPVLDFVQVMIARLVLGAPPWIGDRRHLTHIAMNLGVPRVWVAPHLVGLALVSYWALTRG